MPNIANLSPDGEWFTEAELPFSKADIRISTKITQVLYDQPSEFGHVQVFDTPFYGRMLTLDGIIQVAEKDEFIYHEMMITLPAIKHGSPKSVLIIGGGDGGAVKQALRIKSVERIVLVEIDRNVIDVCKEFIPSIADGALEDPRVEIVIADGMDYAKKCQEQFDIIALDLTDPIPDGPAAGLYEEPFYRDIKRITSPEGVVSTHCSSLVIQPEEAKVMIPRLSGIFGEVTLHTAVIPTYQLTSFGFIIARPNPIEIAPDTIQERFSNISGESKYLSPEIFQASSVIPPYIQQKIGRIGTQ
jgi:spermidine synthase